MPEDGNITMRSVERPLDQDGTAQRTALSIYPLKLDNNTTMEASKTLTSNALSLS